MINIPLYRVYRHRGIDQNGLFDLCNKVYIDPHIQTIRNLNENKALTDLVGTSLDTLAMKNHQMLKL